MATARKFEITDKDLAGDGGGGFGALEVPMDYEALLVRVDDYDYRDRGKSWGWVWHFEIEDLPFKVFTAFGTNARWKLIETVQVFDALVTGINEVDPDSYVGMTVGAHVDFDTPADEWDGQSTRYREIKYLFPLNTVPAAVTEATTEAVPEPDTPEVL